MWRARKVFQYRPYYRARRFRFDAATWWAARPVAVPRAVGCDSRRAVVLLTFYGVCA